MAEAAKPESFSAAERAAMKERARELKAHATRAEAEAAVVEAIAAMSEPDRTIASRIHEIVTSSAPELSAKLWYGQPAWTRNGKVVLFFQSADKFGTRFGTLGFSENATLDDGSMWPTSFAVTAINPDTDSAIAELVAKATR